MKKLFIYYSLNGNGDLVAKKLEELGFELRKVNTKLKLKNNFFGIFRGGFLAGINSKPKLIDYDNNIDEYDEIYIGSPVWNSRLSPAINTVLKETDFKDKKIKFVLYSGSGTAKKATEKINKLYNANIIILKEPKKYNDELKKLD